MTNNYENTLAEFDGMSELLLDVRREAERERERLIERVERVDELLRIADAVDKMQSMIEKQKAEIADLQSELQEEKEQRARLEMQLGEMSKLSAGVAKKASQDELLKALRVFVNKSKRKRPEKRTAVKEMVMELAFANGIALPEDLAATIDSLDDEQPETKVVNVAGNYNDIHNNGTVNRV